jgi:pimeloyl-ACP methyl ester carboxylesterase
MRTILLCLLALTIPVSAQQAPYDKPPSAVPPYYRVRYEASTKPGELIFPVQYTVWIPAGVETLRGVVVHQHGCGEGSCKSGQTGAFDLHWQALAKKHGCALLAPSYEQPQKADCQMWCDPRNGSDDAFRKALADLGKRSGHPELATVPWALWGHSGGGHWVGGMVMLHPERVAAAWLRSGVPLFVPNPERQLIKPHTLPKAALGVPMMCNPGTKEGVTVKDGRFSKVWPANEKFIKTIRRRGGLLGLAVDPLAAHECGNQRYMAIQWLDACLTMRLPAKTGQPLKPMPVHDAWLAPLLGQQAVPAGKFTGDETEAVWLPNAAIAHTWMHYVRDTEIPDPSPPPAPTNLKVDGHTLTWQVEADLESGLAHFIILRDGKPIGTVPETPKNRFGRPIFQGLQYSDTPAAPLVQMKFTDRTAGNAKHTYRVVAVNTVGLKSK